MSQSDCDFELLILENGADRDRVSVDSHPHLKNLLNMFRRNNKCRSLWLGDVGRSPAIPYNRAMVEVETEWALFVDDDIWLQPDYICWMRESAETLTRQGRNFVLSGVTPWAEEAWPGIGPDYLCPIPGVTEPIIDFWLRKSPADGSGAFLEIQARQNVAYDLGDTGGEEVLRPSNALSPGNFMMRPDSRIPWSDVGFPSCWADLAWCLQAKAFLGYEFWFDLRCEAWHVNAVSGGLRSSSGDFTKDANQSARAQRRRVEELVSRLMPPKSSP
jgi:hypothetical protein